MATVWAIFQEELSRTIQEKNLVVHSFVLMSNHFHLIASTPRANISECMHQFMTRTSRQLTSAGNRINETFAGRHFKCILGNHSSYLNAYKYNYRNPVAAGISNVVEEYPFSTLRGLLNPAESRISLCEDAIFLEDPTGTLKWLNTAPDPEKVAAVGMGLKKALFKSPRSRNTGRPIIFENEHI